MRTVRLRPLHTTITWGTLFVLFTTFATACQTGHSQPETTGETGSPVEPADPIERGRYLVGVLDCNGCHTPFAVGTNGPEPDMTRMLSGHPRDLVMPPPPAMDAPWLWAGAATNTAFAGPWGVSYAINLTPHETGLGTWTEDMFVRAIRTGWHMGMENSRRIMPPMPWPAYMNLTDEDLKAVYAYLRTIPPIENAPPAWQPPAQGTP